MGWQDLLDIYEWKARLIPTAILLLPLFWTAYYLYPDVVSNPVLLAGSGVVSIALIYFSAMVVRHLGLRYQDQLWKSWGGPPSTRFGRMRDSFFSDTQKYRIRLAVLDKFGLSLLALEDEVKNPELADRRIMDAFKEVKELLRRSPDQAALVDKHNAEYGFVRNLGGGRQIFVVLAALGLLLCGFKEAGPGWALTPGSSVNLCLLVIWVPFAWFVLPGMLKRNADTYAERAWITFLSISTK